MLKRSNDYYSGACIHTIQVTAAQLGKDSTPVAINPETTDSLHERMTTLSHDLAQVQHRLAQSQLDDATARVFQGQAALLETQLKAAQASASGPVPSSRAALGLSETGAAVQLQAVESPQMRAKIATTQLHLNQLQAQIEALTSQVSLNTEELAQAEPRSPSVRQELQRLGVFGELAAKDDALKQTQSALTQTQTQLSQTQNQLSQAQQERANLEARLAALEQAKSPCCLVQ